jgi:hypothetical protein
MIPILKNSHNQSPEDFLGNRGTTYKNDMNKQIQCKLAAGITYLLAVSAALAQPRFTTQPTHHSVSLGANVTNFVFASGVAPLSYQWRFNDAEIAGAIKRTLILTNVQLANAGDYTIVVTNNSGSVTSRVARLDVDPTFTMITTGPVVTDFGGSVSAAWGDYDNDGFPDLFANGSDGPIGWLYRNKGDGTFERLFTNAVGGLRNGLGVWADYDNDGFLDFYKVGPAALYHNQGNGTFLSMTNAGPILSDQTFSTGLAWGDFDNDGFVDMMVAKGGSVFDQKNLLFHNQGNGTFAQVTAGSIVNDARSSWTGAWADYDDDGQLDLFVTNCCGEDNQLYHNDGPSGFTGLTAGQVGSLVHDGGHSHGAAWGDYDNDGLLELFVASTTNLLYHSNGNGTFNKITTGGIVTNISTVESIGCAWVDYDNDGYLDLIVVNPADNNFLYHNNGNGTFNRIITGGLVNDGTPISCADFKYTWEQIATGKDSPILVVLQMAGGNDGLNTVIPFTNDFYFKERPALHIPAKAVLRLNDQFGLHPGMHGFKALFDEGRLSIVHGAGYPNPNRSHFRSTEIWQTASDANKIERYGWLGRYFDHACKGCDPTIGINIGRQMPQAFASAKRVGVSLDNPENYHFASNDSKAGSGMSSTEHFFRELNSGGVADSDTPEMSAGGSIAAVFGKAPATVSALDYLERSRRQYEVLGMPHQSALAACEIR